MSSIGLSRSILLFSLLLRMTQKLPFLGNNLLLYGSSSAFFPVVVMDSLGGSFFLGL